MPESPSPPPPPGPFRFGHAATPIFRATLAGFAVAAAAAAYAVHQYFHSPYWNGVGIAADQPVLFSHRHHAGELRIDCRFCHASVETSAYAGLPTTQTCLNCHSQVFTDTAMLQPVVRSAALREPLAWTRVTHLPDHVYFNHSIHVTKGVSCLTCHGEVGRMALTAKAEPLDMRWCLDCHRDPAPRLQSPEKLFAAIRTTDPTRAPATRPLAIDDTAPPHLTNCSTCHH
jgi:hypothetical protein